MKSGGREYVWVPSDTDAFFHDLQQRGLGLRRGPVDLVGQQDRGEDGPAAQLERLRRELKDLRAQNIGRHEVRRELDPLEVGVEQPGEALGQQRLSQARNSFEQDMAAGVQRGQKLVEHVVLSEEDPAQAGLEPARVFMKLCEFHRSFSEAESVALTRWMAARGAGRALLFLDVVFGGLQERVDRRRAFAPTIGRAGEAAGPPLRRPAARPGHARKAGQPRQYTLERSAVPAPHTLRPA